MDGTLKPVVSAFMHFSTRKLHLGTYLGNADIADERPRTPKNQSWSCYSAAIGVKFK